jgi:hypothetical protein
VDNEEKIMLLKRAIVYITRPPNQMSKQAKKDVVVLEEWITELGGDTRNDLRALKIPNESDVASQSPEAQVFYNLDRRKEDG